MTGESSKPKTAVTDIMQINEAIEQVLLNIYCPNCQYNLRGLKGKNVQCPECGHDCDITKLVCINWDKPCYKAPGYDKLCSPIYAIMASPLFFYGSLFCGCVIHPDVSYIFPILWVIFYIASYIPAYRLFKNFRGVRLAFILQNVAFGFFLPIPFFMILIIGLCYEDGWSGMPITLSIITISGIIISYFSIKYARKWDRYIAQQCIDQYLGHHLDPKN